jgi:hypothetical protein
MLAMRTSTMCNPNLSSLYCCSQRGCGEEAGTLVTGTTFIVGGRGRNREFIVPKVPRLCPLVLPDASGWWLCSRLGGEEDRVMGSGLFKYEAVERS